MVLRRRLAPHDAEASILEVSGLTVRYDGRMALEDVTFRLNVGERVAVVGPNGAGKSTLFKIIAGVLRPTAGDVRVAGGCPGGHICIAYLPQRSEVDWSFPVSVAEVVLMGRIGKMGWLRHAGRKDWELVRRSLEVVGLADLAGLHIAELSGGQQQRMFIARALAQEAELMLMDEPLTGLDLPAQEDILHILDDLRRHKVTVLVATHDLNLASDRFDRVMLLKGRMLGFGQADQVFTPERLQTAYGGHLRLVQTDEGLMLVSDTCCAEDL